MVNADDVGREIAWAAHTLHTPDLDLAWYDAGSGPPLLFLHGGPGHDHRLVRDLAAPLTARHRCVLFDQRGSGASRPARMDAQTLHIDRFVADIEALRRHLGAERLPIVGWSWGATLGLLYNLAHPDRVERLALVAPGPILLDLLPVYRANLLRPLTAVERRAVADLEARAEDAFGTVDASAYRALFARRMAIQFRVWFHDPTQADAYRGTFLASVEPYTMAAVERLVLPSLGDFAHWENFAAITTPVLVVHGYQDFEPITQAYRLRGRLPQIEIALLNECGHWPWREQPQRFFPVLDTFLHAASRRDP